MRQKHALLTILFFLCLTLFFSPVFAHSGKTDTNGGHWDRSTGKYHFHTGEYAGRSSPESSSNSSNDYFKPPYDPPTKNPIIIKKKVRSSNKSNDFVDSLREGVKFLISFLGSIAFLIGFIYLLAWIYSYILEPTIDFLFKLFEKIKSILRNKK